MRQIIFIRELCISYSKIDFSHIAWPPACQWMLTSLASLPLILSAYSFTSVHQHFMARSIFAFVYRASPCCLFHYAPYFGHQFGSTGILPTQRLLRPQFLYPAVLDGALSVMVWSTHACYVVTPEQRLLGLHASTVCSAVQPAFNYSTVSYHLADTPWLLLLRQGWPGASHFC